MSFYNSSNTSEDYELFFSAVANSKINIPNVKLLETHYSEILYKYYVIQLNYINNFQNDRDIYSSILINYEDIISRVNNIINNKSNVNNNSRKELNTNLSLNDILVGYDRETVDKMISSYKTNINYKILYNIHVLIFYVYNKNKNSYMSKKIKFDNQISEQLDEINKVSAFVDKYEDKNYNKIDQSISMSNLEDLITEVVLSKDVKEYTDRASRIVNKDNNSSYKNLRPVFKPGGGNKEGFFDSIHTKCMSYFIRTGAVSDSRLLELLTMHDKLINIQKRSLSINNKTVKELGINFFFDENNQYRGPKSALTYRLWYLLFQKQKVNANYKMNENLTIKITNTFDNKKLKENFTLFHNKILGDLNSRKEKIINIAEYFTNTDEKAVKEAKLFIIDSLKNNFNKIIDMRGYNSSKDLDYIDQIIDNNYNSIWISFTIRFYSRSRRTFCYLLNKLYDNNIENDSIFNGYNRNEIVKHKASLIRFIDEFYILIKNYYDGKYNDAFNKSTIENYICNILGINKLQKSAYYNERIEYFDNIIGILEKEFDINIKNIDNDKNNLEPSDIKYRIYEAMREIDSMKHKTLINIEQKKEIVLVLTEEDSPSLYWNNELKVPVNLTENYYDILVRFNFYGKTGYYNGYPRDNFTDILIKKLEEEKILIYDYEFYENTQDRENIDTIKNILDKINNIRLIEDITFKYFKNTMSGGKNSYCVILGKKRKIYIKNKKQYIMYNKKMITMNMAKKMDKKKK